MSSRLRAVGFTLLKLGVAAVLVGFLLRQGTLDPALLFSGILTPGAAMVGAGFFLATYFFGALRWQLLLHIQKAVFSFRWILGMTFMAVFFNYCVPGSIGGDAVRMTYTHRAAPMDRGAAALSVALDRILGLYSILFLCLITALANWQTVVASPPLNLLFQISAALVVSGPAGLGLLLFGTRPGSRIDGWVAAHSSRRVRHLTRVIVDTLHNLARHKARAVIALGLSVLAQGCGILSVVWLAQATGIGSLDHSQYALACAWAWIANILPITPGGLGVGEAAFDQICRWLAAVPDAAPYATIFLIMRILSMAASLPGVLVYLTYRSEKRVEPPRAIAETGADVRRRPFC